MSADPKKFYLTTPIYYVNARPHIGHAYTTIVADVLARRHRLLGDETFFLTGTDEHGQKIERSAAAAGIPPQQFTDRVAQEFKSLWDRMGITYDKFIRTTSPEHARGVQKLWRALEEKGFIYLDSYTGSYCVSDEAFVDAPAGTPCPDCGRLLETVTEENYFFKLSAFQEKLIALIESNELKIENESRRNEVLSFVRGGLKDLSISRSSFKWGIPVPGNDKHVIYVWLDALANYITALGYGSDDLTNFEKFWPADLHLVGKEIIRFHCVYWPAFLLAAGLPLPKAITAHGWLLFDNSKMSKSKGNIVRTETILDAFGTLCPAPLVADTIGVPQRLKPEGVGGTAEAMPLTPHNRDLFASDVLRYFLLREIPFGQDGSFSFDALLTRYNADLANGYGNLVSRVLSMIEKYYDGIVPAFSETVFDTMITTRIDDGSELSIVTVGSGDIATSIEKSAKIVQPQGANLRRALATRKDSIAEALRQFDDARFDKAIEATYLLIQAVDSHLSDRTPWKLAKSVLEEDRLSLSKMMFSAAESIRIITALLYPIMPYATSRVWAQLGLGDIELAAKNGELKNLQWGGLKPGTKLGPLSPIFPRADKSLIETMINMENETTTPSNPAPDSTAPDAGPRPVHEPSETLPVGGSTALSTGPDPVPPPAPAIAPEPSSFINIDDFAKIELRVAQIVVAERIPKADKLLRLEVDLGPDFPRRQILSGIAEHYTPEELIGRRIVVITNLAPRKMRGLESHGMLLAASDGENGKPILATMAGNIALGSRLK
jgi:methionyl-tRNA synthetase